jgi:hypothetical protein
MTGFAEILSSKLHRPCADQRFAREIADDRAFGGVDANDVPLHAR